MKSSDLFAFMKRENNFSLDKRKQYILMSNEES